MSASDLMGNLKKQGDFLVNMQQCAHNDFVNLSKEIKPIFDKANSHFKTGGAQDEVKKAFLMNMGQIILDLQFHDIIRQKMEHIQEAIEIMVLDFNSDSGKLESVKDELMNLHSRQVDYISNEYWISSEMIKSTFESIMEDKSTALELGFDPRSTFESAEKFKENCSGFIALTKDITPTAPGVINKEDEKANLLQFISDSYTMQSERELFEECIFGLVSASYEEEDGIELF